MQKKEVGRRTMWVLKSLLASYIVTGILLLALTFLVYQFKLDEHMVVGGIVSIYVISTFIGGIIIGKLTETKKFIWGMFVGGIYVLLLFLISYGVYREISTNGLHVFTTVALCIGGGTLGGMLA